MILIRGSCIPSKDVASIFQHIVRLGQPFCVSSLAGTSSHVFLHFKNGVVYVHAVREQWAVCCGQRTEPNVDQQQFM